MGKNIKLANFDKIQKYKRTLILNALALNVNLYGENTLDNELTFSEIFVIKLWSKIY